METFSVKSAIELAVKTEKEGAQFYANLARQFSDNDDLVRIFTQLSKDEEDHERQFSQILQKLPDEESIKEESEPMYLLQATGASEFFKPDILKTGAELDAKDALLKALNFEKSSLLHYIALNDVIKNSSVKALIEAEKKHVKNLMKIIITDSKFRGLADTW
jgi:rubrerythrin